MITRSRLRHRIRHIRGRLLRPFLVLVARLRITLLGAPRVLRYGMELNAIFLRELGADVSRHNVRILSPVTLHRADLKPDCSNLTIGDDCVLNGNNYLDLSAKLTLEKGVSLGPGVIVMTHNWYNGNEFLQDRLAHTCGYQEVRIREGAGIKAGAVIVMGVTIGRNAVVAAQSVVNRDLPDNSFAAGVPARVVRSIE